jgi:hypothetical protein
LRKTNLGTKGGHRMTYDHNVIQTGVLDVGDDGVHPVGDGQRPKITRLTAPTRQVHRKHRRLRCATMDLVDGEIPAVRSVGATVDEDQRRQ